MTKTETIKEKFHIHRSKIQIAAAVIGTAAVAFVLNKKSTSDPVAVPNIIIETGSHCEQFDVTTKQLLDLRMNPGSRIAYETDFGNYVLTEVRPE